jgi:hypothetical protein
VLALRERPVGAELDWLHIHMHPFEADFHGVRYAGPFASFAQTFMSAPFCAALAWSSRAVTYRALHHFDAPEVLRYVTKVHVIADPSRPRYRPLIRARVAGGRETAWDAGTEAPDFMLTWDAAVSMAGELADEAGVPARSINAMISSVETIGRSAHVRALSEACRIAVEHASAALKSL